MNGRATWILGSSVASGSNRCEQDLRHRVDMLIFAELVFAVGWTVATPGAKYTSLVHRMEQEICSAPVR